MANRARIHASKAMIFALALGVGCISRAQVTGDQYPQTQTSPPRAVLRIALVIGAEHYETLPDVPNALNDAKKFAAKLVQLHFDFVRYVPDPKDDNEIYDYVSELAQRAVGTPDTPVVIVFFFAGHGFHEGSTNYIVPVAASIDDKRSQSYAVSTILAPLTQHMHGVSIFFFDSCRKVIASEEGFTSQQDPKGGAILGLAAKYGQVANSFVQEGELDSPYTTALTNYLDIQGYRLPQLLSLVSTEVLRQTHEKQAPEVYYLGGAEGFGFFFNPTDENLADDRVKWSNTVDTNDERCVNLYIRSHPGSSYLSSALEWQHSESNLQPKSRRGSVCPDELPGH